MRNSCSTAVQQRVLGETNTSFHHATHGRPADPFGRQLEKLIHLRLSAIHPSDRFEFPNPNNGNTERITRIHHVHVARQRIRRHLAQTDRNPFGFSRAGPLETDNALQTDRPTEQRRRACFATTSRNRKHLQHAQPEFVPVLKHRQTTRRRTIQQTDADAGSRRHSLERHHRKVILQEEHLRHAHLSNHRRRLQNAQQLSQRSILIWKKRLLDERNNEKTY